jgi:hypothetical protein
MSQTRMVPFNLTPLTFRNKILIGMGYDYYHWLQNQSVRHKGYMPQPQPQKKEENKIEESIQNSFSRDEVSMSSPKSKPPEAASEPAKSNPPPPQVPQKTIEIDEEDNEMIQDESDQNFNFW